LVVALLVICACGRFHFEGTSDAQNGTLSPTTLRSSTAGSQPSAGTTVDCDLVIPRPPGVMPGDLLFGVIFTDAGGSGSITTPGFTRTDFVGAERVAFWKFVAAVEPSAYTFRIVAGVDTTDTCESAGAIGAFANVREPPILAQSQQVATSTILTAPAVTAQNPAILIGAWGSNGAAISNTSGMMVVGSASSLAFASALLTIQPVLSAGSTGERSVTVPAAAAGAAGLFVLHGNP
jgi:hypothetical protein